MPILGFLGNSAHAPPPLWRCHWLIQAEAARPFLAIRIYWPNSHSSDMAYYKYVLWYLFSSVNSRIEVFEVRGCASFISVSLVFRVGLARKRWLVSVFWINDSMCPSYVPRRNVLHAHWPYSLQNICMPPEDPHTHLLSKEFPKCLHQNEAVLLKNKINITRGKVDNGCLSVVGFQREPEHVFSLPGMSTPTPAPPPHTAQFTCKNPSYLKLICISSENLPWFSPLPD